MPPSLPPDASMLPNCPPLMSVSMTYSRDCSLCNIMTTSIRSQWPEFYSMYVSRDSCPSAAFLPSRTRTYLPRRKHVALRIPMK